MALTDVCESAKVINACPSIGCTSVSKGWNGLACERYTTDHPGYCQASTQCAAATDYTRCTLDSSMLNGGAGLAGIAEFSCGSLECRRTNLCQRDTLRPASRTTVCFTDEAQSGCPDVICTQFTSGWVGNTCNRYNANHTGLVFVGHVVRHVVDALLDRRHRHGGGAVVPVAGVPQSGRLSAECAVVVVGHFGRGVLAQRRRGGLQSADDGAVQQVPHRLERAYVRALQPCVVGSLRRQRCVHHDVRRDSVAVDCAARVVRQRRLHSSEFVRQRLECRQLAVGGLAVLH
jgi:hypothetical protein